MTDSAGTPPDLPQSAPLGKIVRAVLRALGSAAVLVALYYLLPLDHTARWLAITTLVIGLVLGRSLATTLGHAAHWIGAALLIATGGYAVIQAIRSPARHDGPATATPAGLQTGRLLVTGAALSIDNLAVGFALGTFHVSLALAAIVIGVVSVAMSLIGLELGNRIGVRAGDRGEFIGGLVLIGVGIAIASGIV